MTSKRGITLNNCLGEGVSVASRGKGFIQINGRGVLLPEDEAIRLRDWLNAKYPAPPAAAPVAAGEPVAWQMIHRHHPNPSWQNCPKELFDQYEAYHKQYGGESPVRALVVAAPPAAAPVPACEPAGKIVAFGESLHEVSWRKGKLPPLGTELFANAPPAAAHGDEAVRKDAERYRWLRERDLDAISAGGVFAGMTPQNLVLNLEDLDEAIDAAMRAQGDGGNGDA